MVHWILETVRFGYYSQDGLQFDEQMKVIDVVQDIAEVIELGNGKKLTASQFLQHFLFTPETQHSYVYKLSGENAVDFISVPC